MFDLLFYKFGNIGYNLSITVKSQKTISENLKSKKLLADCLAFLTYLTLIKELSAVTISL